VCEEVNELYSKSNYSKPIFFLNIILKQKLFFYSTFQKEVKTLKPKNKICFKVFKILTKKWTSPKHFKERSSGRREQNPVSRTVESSNKKEMRAKLCIFTA
jgi:hypothetical protein